MIAPFIKAVVHVGLTWTVLSLALGGLWWFSRSFIGGHTK